MKSVWVLTSCNEFRVERLNSIITYDMMWHLPETLFGVFEDEDYAVSNSVADARYFSDRPDVTVTIRQVNEKAYLIWVTDVADPDKKGIKPRYKLVWHKVHEREGVASAL